MTTPLTINTIIVIAQLSLLESTTIFYYWLLTFGPEVLTASSKPILDPVIVSVNQPEKIRGSNGNIHDKYFRLEFIKSTFLLHRFLVMQILRC